MVTTAMVFVMVFIAAAFFFVVDQALSYGVRLLVRARAVGLGALSAWPAAGTSSTSIPASRRRSRQAIREQAEQKGLAERFEQILVPTEEVVEVKRGAKVVVRAQVLSRLCAGQDGPRRRDLAPRQEHRQGDRLSRRPRPAVADQRERGGAHHAPGAGRDRAAEAVDHLRDRRAGAGVATGRSPRSTASSRRSTRRSRGSRSRCRSSAGRPRSSWNIRRSRRCEPA